MRRRKDRGSAISCSDLGIDRKPLRWIPTHALRPPCGLGTGLVLLRTLAAGDTVRQTDVGPPPDVAAFGALKVRIVVGSVMVEKAGVALADGRVGDEVPVRLAGSARQLNGRVAARGLVRVESGE